MGSSILKSPSITNLDANPVVANTIGEGAPGFERVSNDYVTAVSADDTTSRYRLCRFPTTAKIKAVSIYSLIASAGSADIDIAFSDSLTDGTQPQFSSLANPIVQITGPVDNKLFGAAQSLVLAGVQTDFTFKGTFTYPMLNIPIWQVLVNLGATQFTSDPGGFFDLYVRITTAVTTGGIVGGKVIYVE